MIEKPDSKWVPLATASILGQAPGASSQAGKRHLLVSCLSPPHLHALFIIRSRILYWGRITQTLWNICLKSPAISSGIQHIG